MQNQDYDYFLNNMGEIYQEYGHKFVAIKNLHILGAYDTFNDALNETLTKEELGTFLIQECFKNKEECIHNFQGNVMPSPA